jgi:hypothetical protein
MRRGAIAFRGARVHVQWFIAGLAVGALACIGLATRLAMLHNRLPIEGQYAVNVQYGPWYLARTGRLFDPARDVPALSNYTSGAAYGAVDFTHTFLHGAALILARLEDPVDIGWGYLAFPWQSLLLLPLAVIAVYTRFCAIHASRPGPAPVALLYAFTAFGHYSMVNWGLTGGLMVPYGWVLILLIYLALLARHHVPGGYVIWSAILAVALVSIQPTYHTLALASLVFLGTITLGQRVLKTGPVLPPSTIVLAAVLFFAFLAYSATPFLRAYALLGIRFLDDIFRTHDSVASQFLYRVEGLDVLLQLLNYMAIAAFPAVILVAWFRARRANRFLNYHILWLAGLVPLAIGFFAWNGVLGMQLRVLQLGTLLAYLSAALLFARINLTDGRRRQLLPAAAAIMLSTGITIYSVNHFQLGNGTLLAREEWAALSWYQTRSGCRSVLFTDFRIGPASTYLGCFGVVGPTAASVVRAGDVSVLETIFYGRDPAAIADGITSFRTTTGQSPQAVLLSREWTHADSGPLLPDGRLKPMPHETFEAYLRMPNWVIVYANRIVVILERQGVP